MPYFTPNSSFIEYVEYDRDREVLALDLKRGGRVYYEAPFWVYLNLKRQDNDPEGSVGEYYNSYIKHEYTAPAQEG